MIRNQPPLSFLAFSRSRFVFFTRRMPTEVCRHWLPPAFPASYYFSLTSNFSDRSKGNNEDSKPPRRATVDRRNIRAQPWVSEVQWHHDDYDEILNSFCDISPYVNVVCVLFPFSSFILHFPPRSSHTERTKNILLCPPFPSFSFLITPLFPKKDIDSKSVLSRSYNPTKEGTKNRMHSNDFCEPGASVRAD